MSKKRYHPEEIIGKLREADVLFSQGKKVVDMIKALGITDVTITIGGRNLEDCRFARQSASRSWRRRMNVSGRRSLI